MRQWYVIHTQTGHENRVKMALERRAKEEGLAEKVSQVLISTERVSEIREGRKTISQRKNFPGYVIVEMELSDDTWYLVKSIPGVTGFVGSGNQPIPLKESEVETLLKQAEDKQNKPQPKVVFEKGEGVRVKEGPFINFNGTIEEVNPAKGKLKVMVSIFGRATPLELEYWQVEKL
ncbi:MAG: transcription termination/antitermination factor NusG [Candidatus Omnitrophica bacterium]|nr:transcription termination/antitermination factor NusG [Candidatus Omnitrophota bacterium]